MNKEEMIADKIKNNIPLTSSEQSIAREISKEFENDPATQGDRDFYIFAIDVIKATVLCTAINYNKALAIPEIEQIVLRKMPELIIKARIQGAGKGEKLTCAAFRILMFATRSYTEDACNVPRTDGTESDSRISCMENDDG